MHVLAFLKRVFLTADARGDLNGDGLVDDADIALDPVEPPFTIIADSCTNATLAEGAGCAFAVRFAPLSAGDFADDADIPSNDPRSPSTTFTVLGKGLGLGVSVVGTTGTVVLDSAPYPGPSDSQIFVFDEQQGVAIVASQTLDIGSIAAGTL